MRVTGLLPQSPNLPSTAIKDWLDFMVEELPWNSLFGQFASFSDHSQKRAQEFISTLRKANSLDELLAAFPLHPYVPQTKLTDLIAELA